MKKIISLLLIFTMLFPVLPVFALKTDFIKTESFNNIATWGTPKTCTLDGYAHVCVVKEGKEKAIELSGVDTKSSLYMNTGKLSGIYSFSFDLLMNNGRAKTEVITKNELGESYTLLTIDETGSILAPDGDILGGFGIGTTTRITVTLDTKDKIVSAYRNKSGLVYKKYLDDKFFDSVSGFGLLCSGKETVSVIADNLAVYKGTGIISSKDVPKSSFNNASEEPLSFSTSPKEDDAEQVPTNILFNYNFEGDDPLSRLSYTQGENPVDVKRDLLKDNNYLIHKRVDNTLTAIGRDLGDNTIKNIVVEALFSTDSSTPSGQLFLSRSIYGTNLMMNTYLNINANGEVSYPGGSVICKVSQNKWTKISLAIHIAEQTYDIYVDGKIAATAVPFANAEATEVPFIRMNLSGTSGTLFVDNFRAYEAMAPAEIPDNQVERSIFTDKSYAIKSFGNMLAVNRYSNKYFKDGKKQDLTKKSVYDAETDTTYLSKEDLTNLFGNSDFVSPHGEMADYYKLSDNAAKFGYNIEGFYEGFYLISKSDIPFKAGEEIIESAQYHVSVLHEMYRFMLYERPSAEEYKALFEKQAPSHPRLIINKDDIERIQKSIKTDKNMAKWADNIMQEAYKTLSDPVYAYERYNDGTGQYQDIEISQNRILTLGMAYQFTKDKRFAIRGFNEMEKICNFSTWNTDYLDVGELCAIVALGYDWLYDGLTETQRALLEKNIIERALNPTMEIYYGVSDLTGYIAWTKSVGNINAVCNGGTSLGAMAIFDKYPDLSSKYLTNALQSIDLVLLMYYPDGAWMEGITYWNYALQYIVMDIESAIRTFGTDLGFLNTPGLIRTGWNGFSLVGAAGMYSFGDGSTAFENYRYSMWGAKHSQDVELLNARLLEMEKRGFEGGPLELAFYDETLYRENYEPKPDSFIGGLDIIGLREKWYDKTATYLGAHGGPAMKDHGHLDIGSFVVDIGGERVIKDIGAEAYSYSGYFAHERYHFYKARPEGHNLYVINPTDDIEDYGINRYATAVCEKLYSKESGSYAIMDLTGSYERDATSAKRGYMLTDDRRSVVIRDEISLKKESDIYWFAHTDGKIKILDNNTAIININGKHYKVIVETNAKEYTLCASDASPLPTSPEIAQSDMVSQGVSKLAIKLKASGDLNITVKFCYAYDIAADAPLPTASLDHWDIPDGEVKELPRIDAIYADGTLLEGFDPDTWGYEYIVNRKETHIPSISASSDKYDVEISQPEGFGSSSLIKVTSKDNPELSRTYTVTYDKLPDPEDVDGMKRYFISNITTSKENATTEEKQTLDDGFISTYYAMEGSGQWVCLELEDASVVEKIGIIFMSGNARVATYKLEVSLDGRNWDTVFDGNSSGTSKGYEFTDVGGKTVKYVRFTGYGNTINTWNSITELAVLGKR